MIGWLAAMAAAAAAWLCWPAPSVAVGAARPGRPEPVPAVERGALIRWRWGWAALAGGGAWAFVGGPAGAVAGVAAGCGVLIAISRTEPPTVRRRRERCRAELPALVELYGIALVAGAAPGHALALACAALPGPAAHELAPVHAQLGLGSPPGRVWTALADHPELGPLGRTMARAHSSGAPVAEAVRALAEDLAARSRLEVEDRARSVGVKAALPLGLLLLPAFLLAGIVPLAVGALSEIGW